jgi:regulator of sigma E protease
VQLVAFITVNLGVFNLLPLPALDGGRLTFLLVELVRRKPIAAKYEGWVHAVGFVLLIGLMVFVTVNDIMKLV